MCLQAIKINSTNCNVLIAPKRMSERANERNAMHGFGFACVTCEFEVRKYAMLQIIVQVFSEYLLMKMHRRSLKSPNEE